MTKCFHELFEAQAARTPDAVAVRDERDCLTFAELDRRADQLAHRLTGLGAGPGGAVAVGADRSVRMVVAVLGILKAGAAYVPVSADDPVTRQRWIAADAGCRVAVVDPSTRDDWAASELTLVELEPTWSALRDAPAGRAAPPGDPAAVAYVLYTSGTTGRPKGVAVEHRQLVNYTLAVIDRLAVDAPRSFLMLQPLSVDSSLTMLAPPLITGGRLDVVNRARAMDVDHLADHRDAHGVDYLKIAPSHLAAMQHADRFDGLLPRHALIVGGEASSWEWMRDLQERCPGEVYGHYGPTEATVGVLMLSVRDHRDVDVAVTPLGEPIANTRCYVVDPDGRPVPPGAEGELWVAGANVARGYLGRPGLTAAAFGPDPFDPAGGRLYRTGDIVRRRDDGLLEFLGRRDDQIKIHGFRVELGEIERVARAHPGVAQAVVVVREDVPGHRRIVGYAVARPDATPPPTAAAVTAFIGERLPAHMTPAAIVLLDRLPLSAHGKVDRTALPAPVAAARRPAVGRSAMESTVEAVWRKLLAVDEIDIDLNFFEHGGHSLLVVQLHHELQVAAGREFPLVDLFSHTTVRAQAAFLTTEADGAALRRGKDRGTRQSELVRRRMEMLKARKQGR